MIAPALDKLRQHLTTGRLARRALWLVPVFIMLFGAAATILFCTDWLLGPQPPDFSFTITAPVYQRGAAWKVLIELPLDFITWPESGRVEYGYSCIHNGGPPGFASWYNAELLWLRASPHSDYKDPNSETLKLLVSEVAPEILRDQRLVGRRVEVNASHPERSWINWRGFFGWWGMALIWAGAVALLAALGILATTGRRSRLIIAGLCPACRYPIRGLRGSRCPECGHELSLHEQTIVAAQIPLPPTLNRPV